MIIAKLSGERDDAKFKAALDDPSLVRHAIDEEIVPHDDWTSQPSRDGRPTKDLVS
jgi:hypothetical protein